MLQLYSNLSAAPTVSQGLPWRDFTPAFQVPTELVYDKKKRQEWAAHPGTNWCMYSGFSGINPTQRVSKDNHPALMTALVADFDVQHTADEICAIFAAGRFGEFAPSAIERSLSGKTHVIWDFDEPVNCYGIKLATGFLQFLQYKLRLETMLAGLDAKAFRNPATPITASGNWLYTSEHKLSATMMRGLLLAYLQSGKPQWDEDITGEDAIGMAVLEAEFARRADLPEDELQS